MLLLKLNYWRPSKIQILRKYGSLMRIDTIYIEMKIPPHFIQQVFLVVTYSLSGSIPLTPLPTGQAGFSKGELVGLQ
jgi:hypothetical protein